VWRIFDFFAHPFEAKEKDASPAKTLKYANENTKKPASKTFE
jgi:hypothetical protein